MATIGKIREKSGLLLFIVGLAMLAFILGDFFSNGPSRPEYVVGEVYGEPISGVEYEYMVNDLEEGLRSTGQRLTEQDREQIRNQVWNDLVRAKIFGGEVAGLGLNVTPEEYNDVRYGQNILPDFKNNPNFKNQETGQFDPNIVKNYFLTLQANFPLYLKNQRKAILDNRLYSKYVNLLKKGIAVNSIEAEDFYMANNSRVDFEFVLKRFADVDDAQIEVTEADVRAYYEEHKEEDVYKQVASRGIDYVSFEVKATDADIQNQTKNLNTLKADFKVALSDSLFVSRHSDNKVYATVKYRMGQDRPEIDAAYEGATVGTVVGPYQESTTLKLAKVLAVDEVAEVSARHILLKAEGNTTLKMARNRADSLKRVIRRGGDFSKLAKTFSQDPGSGAKGGDLGWFGEGVMVAEFNDACFNGRKGDLVIVESQFGIHLIEILDKRKVQEFETAVIVNAIKPSKDTFDNAYDLASEFSIQYGNAASFDAGVKEKNLQVRVATNIKNGDRFIAGIPNAKPLISWVGKAELGMVSEPIELEDRFVVALLTEIKEDGVPDFEDVQTRMRSQVINEKKAEFLTAQIAEAGQDLDAAAKTWGAEIKKAANINLAATSIPGGGGDEVAVIGEVFAMNEGEVSEPVVGNAGVYVLKLNRKTMASPKENYAVEHGNMLRQLTGRLDYESYNALKELAEVKDERNQVN